MSALLGIQFSARVADLLLATFYANYAPDYNADDSYGDDDDDNFDDDLVAPLFVTVVLVLVVGLLVAVIVVITLCFDADLPRPPSSNGAALVHWPGALCVIGTYRQ